MHKIQKKIAIENDSKDKGNLICNNVVLEKLKVNQSEKKCSMNTHNSCNEFCLQQSFFDIVPSLIWPLTVLIFVLIFRKSISNVIEVLIFVLKETDSIQYKDSKWIRREVDKVSRDANVKEIIPEITAEYEVDFINEQIRYKIIKYINGKNFDIRSEDFNIDNIYNLASAHPRSAILELWRVFEKLTQVYIRKKNLKIKPNRSVSDLHILYKNNVFTKDQFKIVTDLRRIRNAVAHSQVEVDSKTANEYVTTLLKIVIIVAKNIE